MKNGNKTDAEIFRSIFEGATDFVYTTDLRGAFTDVNKAAVRLTGYRKKQLIGMNFKDYIPPADQKKIRDAFLGILKTGKPIQDFPLTVTVKDGSKKQFETSAGLRKEGKRIVGFQGISRDVTERIRSEGKIELFHELFDRSPDYISIINLNSGCFVYVNDSLCQDLGYTVEEFRSMTVADIDPTVTASWGPERERERRKEEPVFTREGTVRTKDGSVFPVEITSSIVTLPDGEFMVASARNISARKKFEEKLIKASSEWRSTFDAVNDPVCLLDPEWIILRCNHAMKTFLKKSYDEIIGRKCFELIHGTSNPVKECPLVRIRKSLRREMMEMPQGDRWFHVMVDPILDEKGELKGAVHVMTDITEHKRAEKELCKSEERFRLLVESMPSGVAIYRAVDDGADFVFSGFNAAAERIENVKRDEVLGKRVTKIFPVVEEFGLLAVFRRVWLTGEAESYPIKFYRGKRLSGWRRNQVVRLPSGEIAAIYEDITERKQAEEKLEEAITIINRSPAVTFTWKNETGWPVEFVSENVTKLVGYTLEEWTSGKVSYIDIIYPDDLEMVVGEVARYSTEKGREQFAHEPYRIIAKDGSVHWVHDWTFITRDEKGSITHYKGIVQDITERKQAEEALREKDALLDEVGQIAKIGGWEMDLMTGNASWTRGTYDIVEIDPGQPIPGPGEHLDYYLPEHRPLVAEAIRALIEENKPLDFKARAHTAKGNVKWIHVIGRAVHEGGKCVKLLGTLQDITKNIQAENEIRYLSKIVTQSTESIVCTDTEFKINYMNRAATDLYGWTLDELQGKSIDILNAEPTAPEFQRRLYEIVASGKSFLGEARNRKKDGSTFYCQLKVSPLFDQNGKIMGYMGSQRDISVRKRAEEKLRTSEAQLSNAMEIARLGYWEYDVAEDLFTFNDHFYSIFRTSAERVGGYKMSPIRYAQLFLPPDDRPKVAAEMKEALETADPHFSRNLEHRIIYADGEIGYIFVRFFVVKDDQGRTVKTYGANQDITERKRTEEEVLRSREHLHELARHLESIREEEHIRLSREIHDELGQALTALKIDVFWLKKRDAIRQEKALSGKINTMITLIDQTTTAVKRISTELRPAMLDDLGLVPAVEWQTDEFTKRSGIRCTLSVTPSEIVIGPEMSTAIFRILQESLTNILRYAKATRVKISLTASGEEIELKVADNGTGISEENIKDPQSFGLIGMRERLYPFGGIFDIKGRKGKGTTVSVTIPFGKGKNRE